MTEITDHSSREEAANVSAYESDDAVETYVGNAVDDGLFPAEAKILDRYFEPAAGPVLDVGCGAGRTTAELADRGFDVTGVDVSAAMIREARRNFPDLDVQHGDATNLAFPEDSFAQVLFSYCGLDYVHPESERLAALREVRRVLEPGGVFAFSTHNSLYNLPALVDDWGHLRNFYLENGNLERLGSRYKVDGGEYDVTTYVSNPHRQRSQLREVGFEPVAFVGKRSSPLKYLERRPYYVARNPE